MSDGPVLRFVSPAMLTVSPRQITLNFGNRGPKGDQGEPGPPGPVTVDVGTTTTGLPGTDAFVVNSGTSLNVVLDFTIPRGDKGDQGDKGDPGDPGTPGTPGTDGKSVLNGTGAPGAGVGTDGDFYIDTASDTIYGPKTGGVWPTPGTSLVGPAGAPGAPGTDGLSVLNGPADPTSGDGVDGEFWINTTTNYIFGPKAGGVWPSPGTSLVGPQGPPGPGQDVSAATHEPLGHADRAESTISFSNASRIFTIAPTATTYEVWCAGTKYDLTTQSVTIPNSTGLYYIYFDASGVLHYKTTYFDWPNETPTAYVYWNSGTGKAEFFADERHGIVLDWATHEYLHRTRGAAFATGFSLGSYTTTGTGNLNSDAQVGMGNGTFFDEDLEVNVVATATPTPNTWEQNLVSPGQIPMLRLDGTAWRRDTATTYPLKQGSVRPQYNLLTGSSWSSVDADNGKYVISWVMATNNLNEPVMAILGQSQYASLNTARNVTWDSLVLTGFPVFEFRPLYKLIFLTQTTMTNTPKAALADVQDLRGGSSTGSGTVVSDHGLLAGLADDDHLQYALADGSRGSFDALGAASAVQTNLNTHTALTTTAHGGIVPDTRTVTAGTGLTGGGALSANVTLTVSYGTTSGTAAQGNDTRIVNAVQTTRSIIAGSGLSGGGDLSADRTLSVSFGTTSGTVAAGDDSRITGAAQKASNLSDLASASTARTNLGLGGAAILSVGTVAGTVAAGDDSRFTNARTPTAHASTHGAAGSDPVALASSQITSGTLESARLNKPLTATAALFSGITGGGGTPVFSNASASNSQAVAPGAMYLGPNDKSGSFVTIGFYITTNTQSAGQGAYIVCYNAGTNGMPTTLAWSQLITTGTGTAWFSASLSQTIPANCWLGVHNPSTNAGSVTYSAAFPVTGPIVSTPSSGNSGRHVLVATSQGTTPTADVSAYTLGNPAATVFGMNSNVPGIYVRVT